ncbi:conserved exported hypothetical protein [Tenacibaculum sp. 190130A14a]|uniref:YD repeat-containing protein n=2 Tax=Tenacibaculum polynesiense TaxID=3137857 RepID=A0ABP1F182_9FLAO
MDKKVLFICLLFLAVSNVLGEEKNKNREIEAINHSIIYDLFLNMELTKRNGQIAIVYDYIPVFKKKAKVESVEVNSSLENDYTENVVFLYDKRNRLKYINYKVKRSENESTILFKYELKYKDSRVELVYIKNRLLYKFIYNSDGMLKTVKHFFKNGKTVRIYNVLYKDKEVKFSLDVIRGDDFYFDVNSSKDLIFLNKNNKISSIKFDIYKSKNISYLKGSNILSFNFSKIDSKNLMFKWNYITFDRRSNWTKRESDKYLIERIINYK